jgi:hypothetical protein
VLDKIRAEIESIELLAEYTRGDIKRKALEIIDKYKAEKGGINMADIELVIKIPKELAEKGHWYTDEEMWTVIEAAQNGTPLPKGHGRLGDLDALEMSGATRYFK